MMKTDDILQLLPSLETADLKLIQNRVAVLLAIGPKSSVRPERIAIRPAHDGFGAALYASICEELYIRLQIKCRPFDVFASSGGSLFKGWQEASGIASEANARWFPKQNNAERLSMCRMYAGIILDYLDEQEQPAVWPNIVAKVRDLPAIVDRAFPGYALSGLLGKVQHLRTKGGMSPSPV